MPPNVLGAPKPQSSVMISNTLGAPLRGTTRGGHHGVDSEAFSLITPPYFGSGGGSCFPSMVVVAPGDPGSPLVWICVHADGADAIETATRNAHLMMLAFLFMVGIDIPSQRVVRLECAGWSS